MDKLEELEKESRELLSTVKAETEEQNLAMFYSRKRVPIGLTEERQSS